MKKLGLILFILLTAALSAGWGQTEIRVLIYRCEGAAKTAEIEEALNRCNKEKLLPGYRFVVTRKNFTLADKLDSTDLRQADVLIVPGGYVYQFPRYWEREEIRDWIRRGGGYVGICAGEILAIEGRVEGSFFGSFEGLEIAPRIERVNSRWVIPFGSDSRRMRMTVNWSGVMPVGAIRLRNAWFRPYQACLRRGGRRRRAGESMGTVEDSTSELIEWMK